MGIFKSFVPVRYAILSSFKEVREIATIERCVNFL